MFGGNIFRSAVPLTGPQMTKSNSVGPVMTSTGTYLNPDACARVKRAARTGFRCRGGAPSSYDMVASVVSDGGRRPIKYWRQEDSSFLKLQHFCFLLGSSDKTKSDTHAPSPSHRAPTYIPRAIILMPVTHKTSRRAPLSVARAFLLLGIVPFLLVGVFPRTCVAEETPTPTTLYEAVRSRPSSSARPGSVIVTPRTASVAFRPKAVAQDETEAQEPTVELSRHGSKSKKKRRRKKKKKKMQEQLPDGDDGDKGGALGLCQQESVQVKAQLKAQLGQIDRLSAVLLKNIESKDTHSPADQAILDLLGQAQQPGASLNESMGSEDGIGSEFLKSAPKVGDNVLPGDNVVDSVG